MNISITLTDIDFMQESLDFSKISPSDFENLVFHLLDEMGFSNISWRKGGEGNSATDGGRDLEATFWTIRPGVSKEERYWFEVKHRKHQLEKMQVQSTLLNAAGNDLKDNVVIITNKTISNPTYDWIKEFQKNNKNPQVTIWQGHDLEIILRKNPRTLARFLPSSLAFSGRCKVIESKFSNILLLPAGGELDELWERRNEIYENPYITFIAILAEVAYGDVNFHQWGLDLNDTTLITVAVTGMLNIFPLIHKLNSLERDQTPIINGLVYIIQCLLLRLGAEITAKILYNPEEYTVSINSISDKFKFLRYQPLFNSIFHTLSVQCSKNHCTKVSHLLAERKEQNYFDRFNKLIVKDDEEKTLILSSSKGECQIGLVKENQYCPLGELDSTPSTFEELFTSLQFLQEVLTRRS
ncbi:hypothetical protein A3N51_11410 [Enterobacter kobei]|uniref:restriction endonuclease n=1 Tax=Enterobacter kobei TaxID=208224 RepID=UPI0007B3E986|nr:restriction endonuclease [Enterobacter kobei]KZQ13137.1 hypothetical protein A3N51_11410 [Enterobacter kobei]